jgi:hypothetical protein
VETFVYVRGVGKLRCSVDVKLVAKMEEQTRRFARETTRGVKKEVGGNQDVWDVGGVELSSDGGVAAGRSGVFANSAAIRSEPEETENGRVEGGSDGSEVVEGKVDFVDGENFGQMERGIRGVLNSEERLGQ